MNKKAQLDTDSWDKVSSELMSLKKEGADLKKSFDQVRASLDDKISQRDIIADKILKLESKISLSNIDADLDEKLDKIKSEISDYTSIVSSSNEKIKELSKRL